MTNLMLQVHLPGANEQSSMHVIMSEWNSENEITQKWYQL